MCSNVCIVTSCIHLCLYQISKCTDSVHITEVSGKWQLEVVEDSACGFTAE